MRHEEDTLQMATSRLLRLTLAPCVRAFHIPNGGFRYLKEAARLKSMGVLAGVPDWWLGWPVGQSGFIELKAEKGRLSPAQKEFRDWCFDAGHLWAEARELLEFQAILKGWQVPLKGGWP